MWILIFLFLGIILWLVCDTLLDNQKNEYNVTWAADLLEKAAAFAQLHTNTAVEIFFEESKEIEGGYIIRIDNLHLCDSIPPEESLAQSPLQWDICIPNEDGSVTLRYESGCGYGGTWRHFRRAVFDRIKRQHPQWKINDNTIHI